MDALPVFINVLKELGDGPFKALIAVVLYFGFRHGTRELKLLRESVGKLHESIAVIVERVSSHEKRISKLERKK